MRKIFFAPIALCLIWVSCTKDNFKPSGTDCDVVPTYLTNMREIVDLNCAYSGCHDGTSAPGDYTSYEGMRIHFETNIERRVIEMASDSVMGMPPWYAADLGGAKDLSEEDFMLFSCWIQSDFPEN